MNSTVTSPEDKAGNLLQDDPGPMLSQEILDLFNVVVRIVLSGGVSIFGVTCNVINIVVFYRQGPMSHSSTVILMALSIADLYVCVLGAAMASLKIFEAYAYFYTWRKSARPFLMLFVFRPLNFATQVTCWIMTFLTFERVISVTFPFKVKSIFTPRRSVFVVISMFLLLVFIHIPNLFQYGIAKYKVQNSTQTYLALYDFNVYSQAMYDFYYYASPVFLRFASVIIVIICNVIIFWKVKLSHKFRKTNTASSSKPETEKNASASESSGNSTKEMKLLKMITVISVLFTVCYSMITLQIVIFPLGALDQSKYDWGIEMLCYSAAMFLNFVNSSINTIVYYKMSSRFKEEFHALLNIKKKL